MDNISQIINELGEDRENYFNAVAPPIMCRPATLLLKKLPI